MVKMMFLIKFTKEFNDQGYLIYDKRGSSGTYTYIGMTTNNYFVDTNVLDSDYNFYWVFPYYTNSSGKMIPGGCSQYKYAKGVCAAVTGLKIESGVGYSKISWTATSYASGYMVYAKRPNGKYGMIGMTSGATYYTDKEASIGSATFYWVVAYGYDSNSKLIVEGLSSSSYVYGKAVDNTSCKSHSWKTEDRYTKYVYEKININACNSCGAVHLSASDISEHTTEISANDGLFHGGYHSETIAKFKCSTCGGVVSYRQCAFGNYRPCRGSECFMHITAISSNYFYYYEKCDCKDTFALIDTDGYCLIDDGTVQVCKICGIYK